MQTLLMKEMHLRRGPARKPVRVRHPRLQSQKLLPSHLEARPPPRRAPLLPLRKVLARRRPRRVGPRGSPLGRKASCLSSAKSDGLVAWSLHKGRVGLIQLVVGEHLRVAMAATAVHN